MYNNPKLAIVGYGRSGKDTAGIFLAKITDLKYNGSTSNVALPYIAKELNLPEEKVWAARHANKDYWKKWADEFRKDDPTRLTYEASLHADMIIGIRGKEELLATQAAGLVALTLWIENPRVPVDTTVDFDQSYADVVICNDADYSAFYRRLANFARFAGLFR